jgi:major vault protein
MSRDPNVIRIKPYFYIHILDNNSNLTRVETGPLTYTRQDHEKLVEGPSQMIMVPPRHYCIISNPVVKTQSKVEVDEYGNYRLRMVMKKSDLNRNLSLSILEKNYLAK